MEENFVSMNNSSLMGFYEDVPENEITLCQIDGRLYSMPFNSANISIFTKSIEKHPRINITRDMLHVTASRDDLNRSVFLPSSETFLKKLTSIWYREGLFRVIYAAANPNQPQPTLLTGIAKFIVKSVDLVDRFYKVFLPSGHESNTHSFSSISLTRDWTSGLIRYIAWHPNCTKLAVALLDDSIRIYSNDTTLIPILKCKAQRNITCMEWRPMSASELAVGCENGVIVWTIDPLSVVTRPSSNNAQVLKAAGHTPVVSLSWSPMGDLLASVASSDTAIRVWDVSMVTHTAIKRAAGGGLCFVQWSQDYTKLFASSSMIIFRIWNTIKWTGDRWELSSGRIQSACFSPCGTILLFCTDREPTLFALRSDEEGIWINKTDDTSKAAIPLLNLQKVSKNAITVGGLICSLEWDPRGNHLAVLFKEGNAIALYTTIIYPILRLNPCCLITGQEYEYPCAMAFQKNFTYGSCLTVAWSSGRIQHFPVIDSSVTEPTTLNRITNRLNTSYGSPINSLSG